MDEAELSRRSGYSGLQFQLFFMLACPRFILFLKHMHWLLVYVGIFLFVGMLYLNQADALLQFICLVATILFGYWNKYILEKAGRNKFAYDLQEKEASLGMSKKQLVISFLLVHVWCIWGG